jgi:hypothetical protein
MRTQGLDRRGLPQRLLTGLLMTLFLDRAAVSAPSPSVQAFSLTEGPELSDPDTRFTPGAARGSGTLYVSAVFANECLAQAGIEAHYADIASSEGSHALSRVLWVKQRRSQEGCPDIYSPVTRVLELPLPDSSSLHQIILLDCAGQQATPADRVLRICRVSRASPEAPGRRVPSAITASASPLFGSNLLPSVQRVDILTQPADPTGSTRYRLALGGLGWHGCNHADPHVYLLESRTGVSDRDGSEVVDWLFIGADAREDQACDSEGSIADSSISFEREISGPYSRRVVLVNPSTEGAQQVPAAPSPGSSHESPAAQSSRHRPIPLTFLFPPR